MKVLYLGRGEGKSTELIKKSAETGTYILCATRKDALRLAEQARSLGFPNMPFPVTWDEYKRSGFVGSFINHILIDDADRVLQTIFSTVEIDEISLTKPE